MGAGREARAHLRCRCEAHRAKHLESRLVDFVDLVVRNPLDAGELLLRRVAHRLNCVEASLLEFLEVRRPDAWTLEALDQIVCAAAALVVLLRLAIVHLVLHHLRHRHPSTVCKASRRSRQPGSRLCL